MNTSELFKLLYKDDFSLENLENIYKNNGDYVFRRKKHNINQYYSYLNANGKSASSMTLISPSFPKYLLPPDDIINELEKSPRLSLIEGFRKNNWEEMIGEYYCKMEDIETEINPKKKIS